MISLMRELNARSRRGAFTRVRRIDFYRAMYLYQRAGARKLPALRKLSETYGSHLSLTQRIGNKIMRLLGARKDIFRPVIAAVAETGLLRRNLPLAEALHEWLPPAERDILASGEASGDLVGALEMASRFAKQQGGIWAKALQSLTYPVFLIGVVMGILYYIADSMIPTMQVFNLSQFSPMTQAVLWAANWVHTYWFLAVSVPALLLCGFLMSLSRWTGTWRVKVDRFAPWSFYRRVHGALFLYSFAVLRKSGIPSQSALANLASTANPWLRTRITAAMYGIREGYNLGEAFRRAGHEFPDWEAIPVLESISSLSGSSDALILYADDWLQDTTAYIDRFIRRVQAVCSFWVFVWVAMLALTILEIISISFR